MCRDAGTHLGDVVPEGARPRWNPSYRAEAVGEPDGLRREPDFTRSYPNMGADEFQRRLAAMLRQEGVRVHAWESREPDFLRRLTTVSFYVAAPHGSDESWAFEGDGANREDYVRAHPSCPLDNLEVAPNMAEAGVQTEPCTDFCPGLPIWMRRECAWQGSRQGN